MSLHLGDSRHSTQRPSLIPVLPFDTFTLYFKVHAMEPDQAAVELATIRTLMERAALYRRALAPMTLAVGAIGTAAGGCGLLWSIESPTGFAALWFIAAGAALLVAFFVVRRQSLQAAEPLWTPPTRRVVAALAPALGLGGALAIPVILNPVNAVVSPVGLATAWLGIYGLGLNAAGFFMPRGIRWFGVAFVMLAGLVTLGSSIRAPSGNGVTQAHELMILAFGFGHLAYGVYLRVTERPTTALRAVTPSRRS